MPRASHVAFCKSILAVCVAALCVRAQVIFKGPPQSSPLQAPQQSTPPEKRCVVAGKVLNVMAGEPLKKANVRLVKAGARGGNADFGGGQQGYSATTAADGSFRIESVEPGEYYISAEKAGYLNSVYGTVSQWTQGTKISLSPSQQITDQTVAMAPQSVISGRVVDGDGDPMANMNVIALSEHWQNGVGKYWPAGMAQTDEEGKFRIADLQPGTYYVVAQQGWRQPAPLNADEKPTPQPVRTYFPDALTRDAASPVRVQAGSNAEGLEVRMQFRLGHHVRGRVSPQVEGKLDSLHPQLIPADSNEIGMLMMAPPLPLKADRTFDIPDVTPGRYYVTVMQFGERNGAGAEAYVEVGDSDVSGVEVMPMQPFTLHGQITIQGTPQAGAKAQSLQQVQVHLSAVEFRGRFFGSESETKENGAITVKNVFPAKYEISLRGLPKGTYAASAILGGNNDVLHSVVDMSNGAPGELQIVLRYGTGRISGTVVSPDNSGDASANKPVSAIVYAVPDDNIMASHTEVEPDQNGAFVLNELWPRKYHVIAAEGIREDMLNNPEVRKAIAASGTAVEINENDRKQVQLTVMKPEDVAQMFARAGVELN